MFIGIDGTGEGDPDTYARDMRGSFIHELVDGSPERNKRYFRGPTLAGVEVTWIAQAVESQIQVYVERRDDRRILLAGYSRGGAAAIVVAQRLRRHEWARDLQIECMALFDAVDRDVGTETTVIPGNVLHVYHALRAPSVGSRWYFGNCGLEIQEPGAIKKRHFRCTHAGMGGVPWTGDHPVIVVPREDGWFWETETRPAITEEEDRANSRLVHDWIWSNVRRHGMVE